MILSSRSNTFANIAHLRKFRLILRRLAPFQSTSNYGALRAPPLLDPAPRGHCRFHAYNGPCAKEKFGLGRPLKALRPLEGPGEALDHQGPPGINAVVKRNRLSQKKIFASAGLWWPRGRWRVLGGPDTIRDHQGLTLGSKGIIWAKKKIRPRLAFNGLWRPPEARILKLAIRRWSVGQDKAIDIPNMVVGALCVKRWAVSGYIMI